MLLWGGQARLVMRSKGQLRLLMNANLWPEIKVTPMDGGKVLRKLAAIAGSCRALIRRSGTACVNWQMTALSGCRLCVYLNSASKG